MTTRIFINATQPETELRVATLKGQLLDNFDIETTNQKQKKGNIYIGTITRVEASLDAVFVDYGSERHGFLSFREIAHEYFEKAVKPSNNDNGQPQSVVIKDALKVGQKVIVQVDKEERGSKGAALTTFISLAGCYLVLMPNNPRAGGISRRIEGEEREELRNALSQLEIPEDVGVIIRTAGVGRSIEELQWDLSVLLKQWSAIKLVAKNRKAPCLIHEETNIVFKAMRDYLRPDISEIIVDNESVYHEIVEYLNIVRPDFVGKVKFYNDNAPLFTKFQIESQIQTAFQKEVKLPSGGAIVIDHTEALIAIDINSAKSTSGTDIEETALLTNLEAANEIARQLRLRDLGGLVVIDFIDMEHQRNQRTVESALTKAFAADRAKVHIGRISKFGLLEMSRQRIRSALQDTTRVKCPRCNGEGNVINISSLATNIIRNIEENAIKIKKGVIKVELSFELATFLLNDKKRALVDIENKRNVRIVVLPNQHMQSPNFIISTSTNEADFIDTKLAALENISHKESEVENELIQNAVNVQKNNSPAVRNTMHVSQADTKPKKKPEKSIISRIFSNLFGDKGNEDKTKNAEKKNHNRRRYYQKSANHHKRRFRKNNTNKEQ